MYLFDILLKITLLFLKAHEFAKVIGIYIYSQQVKYIWQSVYIVTNNTMPPFSSLTLLSCLILIHLTRKQQEDRNGEGFSQKLSFRIVARLYQPFATSQLKFLDSSFLMKSLIHSHITIIEINFYLFLLLLIILFIVLNISGKYFR